ncbi:hypothetical protein HPB48_002052 [Haemaphysalis longicornis]|uniref:Uncharacterized protein n=1 Tax=Haemaphysalis longicornis TaxID=44386 RepID=A0A9J6FG45_HAELO|nr:hypothetical protein HPB48_002052 [Haemaphysalis longicornis]
MDDIEKITARLRARALRVDRACTQESGSDCWLLWDLEAWNKVLAIVGLELIEAQPGRLALQALPTTRRQYFDKNEFYAAAFVFSWLPEAHRCIQAIKLEGSATELFYRPTFALALALGRSCNIRDLALRGGNHTFMCEEELVEGLRSLRALQSLDLSNFPVNETIGKHLVALLRRNSDHLTSAAIEGTDMSFNTTNQILSALNSCRHLNQLSLANNELNHKCIKTLSSLLRASKSLRKLTLGGCFRAYVDLRVLSDALEVNASLNELSLRRCEADLTLVLKALSTNKILKRLDLSHSRLNNTQVATLSTALQRNTALQHLLLKHCGINDAAAEALAAALKTNCTLEMLNLKCNIVSIAGVAEFCEALRNNTTIKMIQFCGVAGSQNER